MNVNDGFDIVIGNPPYVSAPTMVSSFAEMRREIIATHQYKTLYQKWDLYVPFVELGLTLLTNNGVFSMIVPYPLTNQTYGMKLRGLIVNQFRLIEIVDLNGNKIFENATVSNCIPIIVNAAPRDCFHISRMSADRIERIAARKLADLVQDQKTLVWNLSDETRNVNRHAEMYVLGDYCYITKGMVLNSDECVAQGEFAKDDLISEFPDDIHSRQYIEAKDIERYRVKNIRYLEYDTERCPGKLSRPTFRELYDQPKLMFNRLGALQVILDADNNFLHSDSMFSAVLWKDLEGIENKSIASSVKRYSSKPRNEMTVLSEQIDLRYLLGVLNSRYASVLLANIRGGDYHIYPEHIRNLPIPLVSRKMQQSIINLVNRILDAKKVDPSADTNDLEAEIDRLVYGLYGLTDEEIEIVEGKQKIQA